MPRARVLSVLSPRAPCAQKKDPPEKKDRLLDQLVERGGDARERHDAIQAQILQELRHDAAEREAFRERQSAPAAALDDAARREMIDADAWRAELIARFSQNLQLHLEQDEQSQQPLTLSEGPVLREIDSLFSRLEESAEGGDAAEGFTWRDAERELGAMRPRLDAVGAPPYEANEETLDDALDYAQHHNVVAYLADLRWRARLNSARAEIERARADFLGERITPINFVQKLEEWEARGVFPSDWFYTSGLGDDAGGAIQDD